MKKIVGTDSCDNSSTFADPDQFVGLVDPDPFLEPHVTLEEPKGISSMYPNQSVLWSKVTKYGRGNHPRKTIIRWIAYFGILEVSLVLAKSLVWLKLLPELKLT